MAFLSIRALITPTVSMVPAICCKLVACFDPYVYAISHPRFRFDNNGLLEKKYLCYIFLERSCRQDSLDFAPASMSLLSQQRLVKLPHKMPLLKSQDFKRDPLSDDDVCQSNFLSLCVFHCMRVKVWAKFNFW